VLGIVARYLQPAGFGRLNLAVTATAIAATLANLGLEGVVVSELIRRPAQTGAVLGTALRLRLAGGLGIALVLAALAMALHARDAPLVTVVALGLLFQPVDVVDLWFQRHLDSRRTVVARFLGIMAGATLKLWLVVDGAALLAFAWAQVADVAFIALALGWAGWSSPHPSGRWSWDVDIARTLWRRGAPLAVAADTVAFALRLDQFLVRAWLGEQASGIYFASARLIDMALFTGAAATLSLFPALAASHAGTEGDYHRRLQALFDALSALGWLVATVCTVGGPWIIRFIYGPAYAAAAPVLAVQGWACLFALSAGVRWNFILLSAPPMLNVAAAILHIGTLVAMSAWLAPLHGTVGVAMALLGANVVSGILTSLLFPPLRACASAQIRGLLIVFTPARWGGMLRQFLA
jgi:PST family polysaccharide transporter